MDIVTDNIIPGNHGKLFGTNAVKEKDLTKIKNALLKIEGVKDVILNMNIYPREFTIHTTKIIMIETIEKEVKRFGFNAIPKDIFKL